MARFQKGQPKPPGSGRKAGQRGHTFYRLLDGDGFNLKEHVRSAIKSGDPEWVKALAALLKAIEAGAPAPDAAADDPTAKLLAIAGLKGPA